MGPIVGIIALVAGTALTAIGQVRQGEQQAAAARANARIAQVQARETRFRAQEEARLKARKLRQLRGKQRAGFAASGVRVFEGTPLLVDVETAVEGKREIDLTKRAGEIEAGILNTQAENFKAQAKQAKSAGILGAATSILGAAAGSFLPGGPLASAGAGATTSTAFPAVGSTIGRSFRFTPATGGGVVS